jgi:hypothetical protein
MPRRWTEGRMLNHDTIIAHEASPAVLAAIGITPLGSRPLIRTGPVDRELILSVSDGFTRQTWLRDDQLLSESRDMLSVGQHEHIRITVSNDMPGVRVVSVGDSRLMRIRSGCSASIDVAASATGDFVIKVIGEPAISRPVAVQARKAAELIA